MIDGRLLLPALGSWAGAVAVVVASKRVELVARHEWAGRMLIALVIVLALGLVCAGLLVGALRARYWLTGPRTQACVALVIGLLIGVGSAAVHVRALAPPPLGAWIASRATATVEAVIVTPPVVRSPRSPLPWGDGSGLEMRVATSAVTARGSQVTASLPMLLRLPVGAEVPGVGTTVQVTGRLGPPSTSTDLAATLSTPRSDSHALAVISAPGVVDRVANAMRAGLQQAFRGTDPDAGALVAGLSIGDESGLSSELREAMQASGLSHLTAVSGGNVAVVVLAVLGLMVAVRAKLVARAVAALAALAFFVVLVGPAPSVIRAAVMAGLVLIGMLVGGRRAGPSVLCASVLVLTIAAPGLVASWGFALSAFATGGLIMLSGPIGGWLAHQPRAGRLPPAVREGLAVTVAAQLATAPVLLAMGAPVGWIAVPANVMAMPVVAPITVLGLLSAGVSPLAPTAATLMAHVASWPAAWIARVAFACVQLPAAQTPWPPGLVGVMLFAGLIGVGLVLRLLLRRWYPTGVPALVRSAAVLVGLLVVLGWVLYPADRRSWPPSGWLMIMCDVGQGDALLLNTAPGHAVAVDVGPEPDAVDRCLRDARISALPAIVLTHFHADHVNGLAGALRGREVAKVLASPIREPPAEAQFVDRVLAERHLVVEPLSAGDTRSVGDVTWRAVWPRRRIASGSVPNNASVVLMVQTHQRRILLMGDAEPEAQAAVAADVSRVRFDVVKVPHHGSRYQQPMLTRWVPASVALISVGAGNDYGHPAPSTIAAWRAIGAIVARTDEVGDVAVVASASGVAVVPRHGMLQSS